MSGKISQCVRHCISDRQFMQSTKRAADRAFSVIPLRETDRDRADQDKNLTALESILYASLYRDYKVLRLVSARLRAYMYTK